MHVLLNHPILFERHNCYVAVYKVRFTHPEDQHFISFWTVRSVITHVNIGARKRDWRRKSLLILLQSSSFLWRIQWKNWKRTNVAGQSWSFRLAFIAFTANFSDGFIGKEVTSTMLEIPVPLLGFFQHPRDLWVISSTRIRNNNFYTGWE